jgi:hypothetical protein
MSTQNTGTMGPAGPLRSALALFAELKSNRRALGGVLAISGIVAVYGLLQFDDVIAAKRGEFRQQSLQMQRELAVGADHDWTARAKESADAYATLESRLWSFENEGVALANFQDWITGAGRDAKLDKMQIRVELAKPKGLSPDIRQLTANLTAIPSEESLIAFLDRIGREPHMLVVDQLHVQQRPANTMQMTLVSYVKLTGAAGDAAK